MKRELKQKMKEDEFQSGMASILAFVQAHWNEARLVGIGVAVVALAALGMSQYRANRAAESSRAMFEALETLHAPTAAQVPPGAATQGQRIFATDTDRLDEAHTRFAAVAEKFGSAPVGQQAEYYAGLCLLKLGRLDEAETTLRRALAEAGASSLVGTMARLSLAEVERERGNTDAAVVAYQELAGNAALPYPRDVPLMRLASALEAAGRPAEAGEAYRRLATEFPDSVFAPEARQRADYLAPERQG